MKFAIIKNGEVINTIVAKNKTAAEKVKPYGTSVVESATAARGDSYANGEFTRPKPAPIVATPKAATKLEFVEMCQEFGGMTDEKLVAAWEDAALKALWIKFELATKLAHDSDNVSNGLAAMEAKGYLDEGGKETVLNNWIV